MFDSVALRKDFPILSRQVHGKPLVYLDNAATSQKPKPVVEAISNYYFSSNANVHRGVHTLSDESTQAWEAAREKIAQFFGADPEELLITRNTTEAINGIAYGWADNNLKHGDVLLTTPMEHHSNLVVWQEVCKRTGATLDFLEIDATGRLVLADLERKLNNCKLVALTHVSNALGTRNPIGEVIDLVRATTANCKVLIDGAQSAPHLPIDFRQLKADFFVFSGHKMLGPMGSGGVLVKKELLASDQFKPWLFGGGMIATVDLQHTTFSETLADRFTAGTPDVASVVGLAAACEYLQQLDMKTVEHHDRELVQYALEKLKQFPQLRIVGPLEAEPGKDFDRVGSVSFMYEGVHAHDVAQVLDSEGVAVRSGHHCTMPLHSKFDWQATVRVSFQVYNTPEDIDVCITALKKVQTIFGV